MGFPPELYLIILIMKLNLQGQTVESGHCDTGHFMFDCPLIRGN